MTQEIKDKLEQVAQRKWEEDQATNPRPVNPHAYVYGFEQGAKEVIEHPERYDLVPAAHTAALRERVKELESDSSRVLNEVKEINQLAKKTRANVTLRIVELETENTRLREALERAYNDFKSSRWTEETYKIVIEALKQGEQ